MMIKNNEKITVDGDREGGKNIVQLETNQKP